MANDPATSPSGEGQRILLVDDEVDILELLEMFLAGNGYQVETFTSSSKALERLVSGPNSIDIVVTDMTMPDLSGLELAEKIGSLRPGLPVMLMTGHRKVLESCGSLPPAIREVMIKPFELPGMVRRIAQHLADRKDH